MLCYLSGMQIEAFIIVSRFPFKIVIGIVTIMKAAICMQTKKNYTATVKRSMRGKREGWGLGRGSIIQFANTLLISETNILEK